jgi:hypothetical protein
MPEEISLWENFYETPDVDMGVINHLGAEMTLFFPSALIKILYR